MKSIVGRISDLLSANVNAMLDRAEDPEKMADEYLRQLRSQLYEAKTSVAAAMADERKLQQRAQQQEAQVREWQTKAATALRNGDEALARAALQRKVQAEKLAEQYREQYSLQAEQVRLLQDGLGKLETRIAETQAKRELIIAKKNRVRTQQAMQQTARGLSRVRSKSSGAWRSGWMTSCCAPRRWHSWKLVRWRAACSSLRRSRMWMPS